MVSQIFLFSVLMTVLIIDRYFLKKGAGKLKTEISLSNEGNYSSKRRINYQIKANRLLLFLSVVFAGIFLTNHYLRFLPVEVFKIYTSQLGIAFNYILFCLALAWTFSTKKFSESKKIVATEILLFFVVIVGFSIFFNQIKNYVSLINEERQKIEANHFTMQYVDSQFIGFSVPDTLIKSAKDLGYDFIDYEYYERPTLQPTSNEYSHTLNRTILPRTYNYYKKTKPEIIVEYQPAKIMIVEKNINYYNDTLIFYLNDNLTAISEKLRTHKSIIFLVSSLVIFYLSRILLWSIKTLYPFNYREI